MIHALETATSQQKEQLSQLMKSNVDNKVNEVLSIFKKCKVDEWAAELKQRFVDEAMTHLEDVAVITKRKEPLEQLALFLTQRQY